MWSPTRLCPLGTRGVERPRGYLQPLIDLRLKYVIFRRIWPVSVRCARRGRTFHAGRFKGKGTGAIMTPKNSAVAARMAQQT